MIFNTIFIPYISFHCTNDVFLKFLRIHCSLIKKYDFFCLPMQRNEGIFVARLDVKEEGGGFRF